MAEPTNFELVTPSRIMISRDAEMVVVPGAEGLFGVLHRHAPMLSTLKRGVVDVYDKGQISDKVMIDGGIADVREDGCTILAERAERLEVNRKSDLQARLKAAQDGGQDNEADFLKAVLDALAT